MERLLATAETLAGMGSWAMTVPRAEITWSAGLCRVFGFEPDTVEPSADALIQRLHPDDRERVRSLVERVISDPACVPSSGLVWSQRVVRPDGSIRDVRCQGCFTPDGGPGLFFGVLQDVTEQTLTERDLQAHYAVDQALREWHSFDEGIVDLLRRIGTALDFRVGALWIPDPASEYIVCRAFWHAGDTNVAAFEASTRALRFRPDEPTIGRAWTMMQPSFVADIAAEPRFLRRETAVAAGLRTAFAFPAIGSEGTVAALSFYGFSRQDASERFMRTLSGIGGQVGRFLERRRAQLHSGPLSARELEVVKLAAEGNSGPQIASRLVVSPSTIKTHFENIYEKLGVSDRAGAVAHALRIGLIQ